MGNDTVLHVTIGLIVAAGTGVFTAGGFYIYMQMSIKQLQKDAAASHALLAARCEENYLRLDKKIDKNFETLDLLIDENKKELLTDLGGIGGKVSRTQEYVMRRFNNMGTALLIAASPAKEHDVAMLMKEN